MPFTKISTRLSFSRALVLTLLSLSLLTADPASEEARAGRPSSEASSMASPHSVDFRELVSRSDLNYERQVERSEAGLPIGNGRMGSLVWTSPDALHLQINRNDIFGINRDCEYTVTYCGGAAKVDLHLGPNAFPKDDVPQHLSMYEAKATVQAQTAKAEVIAANEEDAMAIRVTNQKGQAPAHVDLKMLRPHWVKTGVHSAISHFQLTDRTAVLIQTFKQGKYFCRSAVAVKVPEREVQINEIDSQTSRLSLAPGSGDYTVWIGSAATFDPSVDVAEIALRQCRSASEKGYDRVRQSQQQWWEDFWSKSYIQLHSEDGKAELVEQAYTTQLYLIGSTSRGKYPTKFNGMLWSTGGDSRRWGSKFWWWNTQATYWGPMASNHMELTNPVFDMYTGMYDSAKLAAKQQWDCEGIYIPEVVDFDGLEELSDEYASELSSLMLDRKMWKETSVEFRKFTLNRNGYSSRWNFIHAPYAMPHSWVSHIFFSQAQIAWHYWRRYEYTLDREWLESRAYPMLRGVAQFYRTYPNIRKGEDGKYHIHNVNGGESVWGGKDTHEEISAMRGILPIAIKASEILDVDKELRAGWQELLDNLTPLPTNTHPDAINPRESQHRVIWTPGLKPAKKVPHRSVGMRPCIHYDLVTQETPNSRMTRLAHGSYSARSWQKNKEDNLGPEAIHLLEQIGIAAAMMGYPDDLAEILHRQALRIDARPNMYLANRLTMEEGFDAQSNEHLGHVTRSLQLGLCQSVPPGPGLDPVIRVFPTWPKQWDAKFSLRCRRGFLVSSAIEKGTVQSVQIVSELGEACRIRNPWPGQQVQIQREGEKEQASSESLLVFPTKPGQKITLVLKTSA